MNSAAARVVDLAPHARHADLQQAEYYQILLDELRADVNEELAEHRASLARREQNGDLLGISRLQRMVRLKQTELTTINRLTDALSARFPTSQTYQPQTVTHAQKAPSPGSRRATAESSTIAASNP